MSTLSISDIPTASQLEVQLGNLNDAVVALADGGAVINITVTSNSFIPITVNLNPPSNDPALLQSVAEALQHRADDIEQELVDMGYEKTTEKVRGRPLFTMPTFPPMPPILPAPPAPPELAEPPALPEAPVPPVPPVSK